MLKNRDWRFPNWDSVRVKRPVSLGMSRSEIRSSIVSWVNILVQLSTRSTLILLECICGNEEEGGSGIDDASCSIQQAGAFSVG